MNKTTIAQQAKTASFLPPAQGVLQRQCACGNHTVAGGECAECGKKKSGLQRKLTIGASNDPLEQEVDRVADQVMAASAHSAVSGAPPRIQRYAVQATGHTDTAPASVDHVLGSPGRPLDPALQQDMEQRFGHDFSRVRVHSGAAAEQSAQDVNAYAYTVGHNVVFGTGRFAPGTHDGRRLIAHELTHVVQQSGADRIRVGHGNTKHGLSNISDPSPLIMNNATPPLGHKVSPPQIARVTRSGTDEATSKSLTPPGSVPSTGSSASPSLGSPQGSPPQRLRFDILGADTALADHLAKAAGSSRNSDLRVTSLEDMISQLENKTPPDSGLCVEHISIFNHGNPYQQSLTGEGKKSSVGGGYLVSCLQAALIWIGSTTRLIKVPWFGCGMSFAAMRK